MGSLLPTDSSLQIYESSLLLRGGSLCLLGSGLGGAFFYIVVIYGKDVFHLYHLPQRGGRWYRWHTCFSRSLYNTRVREMGVDYLIVAEGGL